MADNREYRNAWCHTHQQAECESCAQSGEHVAATTHSTNPEWSGYRLCEECAAEYNARPLVCDWSLDD